MPYLFEGLKTRKKSFIKWSSVLQWRVHEWPNRKHLCGQNYPVTCHNIQQNDSLQNATQQNWFSLFLHCSIVRYSDTESILSCVYHSDECHSAKCNSFE